MAAQTPITLNADLHAPAQVDTHTLTWTASPMAGVERRMIERDGGEVARATSLVRYAAGSRFAPHRHDKGEEYLVLDGTFSDESGHFPQGAYVRNPPGSSHAPYTEEGCVIFVKLRQMPDDEAQTVHVDTKAAVADITTDGFAHLPLFTSAYEQVAIEQLHPGTKTGAHRQGGEEILVLDGTLLYGGQLLGEGTWLRRPAGQEEHMATPTGCRIWVKRGHLPAGS